MISPLAITSNCPFSPGVLTARIPRRFLIRVARLATFALLFCHVGQYWISIFNLGSDVVRRVRSGVKRNDSGFLIPAESTLPISWLRRYYGLRRRHPIELWLINGGWLPVLISLFFSRSTGSPECSRSSRTSTKREAVSFGKE